MSDFNKDTLISLVSKTLDKEINNEEFETLSEILKGNSKAQVFYLEMVDLHTALDDKSFSRILKSRTPRKRKKKKALINFPIISTAAILMTVFSLFYMKSHSNFKVVIENSQNAQLKNQTIIHGQQLKSNLIELDKGLLNLKFSSGAQLVIEGPAKLEILSEKDTRLNSGKIFVSIPPQAKGFSVKVGTRKVVDLGTAFAIQASDSNELHVFDGLVELLEDKENKIELEEGKALRFSKGQYPQNIKLNQEKFSSLKNFLLPSRLFNFEEGPEGWTQTKNGEFFDRGDKKNSEQTKGIMRFIQSNKATLSNLDSFGNNLCKAHSFTGRILPAPFYARDMSTRVSIISSPPFTLSKNGGDIEAFLHGGCGAVDKLKGSLEELGADSHENGFLGLALRRVSDNHYVASVRRKARVRETFRKGWEKVIIPQEELNRILDESQPNEKFVLDLVDAFSSEEAIWSWTALDTVTIPANFDNKEKK